MANVSEKEKEELNRRQREEYEMQLFGFHSRTVKVTIKEMLKDCVEEKCQRLKSSIQKNLKLDDAGVENLNKNIQELKNTYLRNMQSQLEALEKIIDKYICVPSYVLLESDLEQKKQYTDEEYSNLRKEVEDLQTKSKRITVFNAALKEEMQIIKNLEPSILIAEELCSLNNKCLKTKKIDKKTTKSVQTCYDLKKSLDVLKPKLKESIYNPSISENDLENIFDDI